MRKYFGTCFIHIFFLLLFFPALAQNTFVTQIISEMNSDSLLWRAEQISGTRPVVVNGITDTIKSRNKTKPGNELCYRFIREKFNSFGLATDSLLFGATGKNALAIQPGSVYPATCFIICAHYDSMPNSLVSPAADDDGSGVAAVLEAARILSRYEFEYTIIYALWDEEEYGLAGSAAYASAALSQTDSLAGVLNMDAIAWDGNNDNVARIHAHTIANSLSLASAVDGVNNTYNIGLDLILVNPGATYSDHASFWSNGFGALLIIQDWENDPNPHYHTATDLVTNFNSPYFLKLSTLSIASVATLAVPVAFYSNKEVTGNHPTVVFPNPATEFVYIDLPEKQDKIEVTFFTDQGEKVESHLFIDEKKMRIRTAHLHNGMYFIRIQCRNETRIVRMVKAA